MKNIGFGRNGQRGHMLIELMVAVAILGLIITPIVMSIYQNIVIPKHCKAHMTAVKQVENAIHWLSRDVQQAQIVEPSGDSGFPLELSWVDWDGRGKQVTYTLEAGELQRGYSIDGGEPTRQFVAEYIDSDLVKTSCQYTDGIFMYTITADLGGSKPASETRTGEILPRAIY